jgi:hypothetical protein
VLGKGTAEDWTGRGQNVEQEDCKSIRHEDGRVLGKRTVEDWTIGWQRLQWRPSVWVLIFFFIM